MYFRRRIQPPSSKYPSTCGGSSASLLVYCCAILSLVLWLSTRSSLPRPASALRPGQPTAAAAAAAAVLSVPSMEELRAEIALAFSQGTVELDWSNRGLTSLPAEIGSLVRLEKLNLAGNSLSSLPEELSRCTSLRTLFFLSNHFTAIPSVIGRLPALHMLSFKSNRLEAIPEDALPPSLGWLILTDNALTTLPASLGRLSHLRKLMLASNQLRALPDLSGLTSLELVRLSDNRLSAFPAALLSLPRLAWLAVAGNEFQPMPRAAVDSRLAATASPLTLSDVTLEEVLGEGTSGIVYSASRVTSGSGSSSSSSGGVGCSGATRVAVKMFKAASSDGRPVDEVAASLSLTPHSNLINLLGFLAERDSSGTSGAGGPAYSRLASFQEFCSGMKVMAKPPSFATVTRDVYPPAGPLQGLTLAQAHAIATAIASAAAHLHASGICHGDLYAHNILVDPAHVGPAAAAAAAAAVAAAESQQWVKLGDLGAAFFYTPGSEQGALVERVEVRAWACLVEELLGLVSDGGGGSALEGSLVALSASCGALGGSVAARPSFAEIVAALGKAGAGV